VENELQLKQSDTTSREVIDHKPMGDLVLIQRMVDKAADMVFLLGPMGRIQYANEAACKALGYTREELLSMTVLDFNQKHHADNWQEHEEELKKQGSMTFENVLKTKDNHLIPVEICANYAKLGDKEYNYSFTRDITERKQAEMELEKHRKHLEDLVQERTRSLRDVNIRLQADIAERKRAEDALRISQARLVKAQQMGRIGNWEWDIENDIENRSEELLKLFDFKTDTCTVEDFLNVVHPDDREYVRSSITAAVNGLKTYNLDFRMVSEGNPIHYMHAEAEVIHNVDGKPVRMFGIAQDITERKQAEEAMKASKQLAELYLDLMGHDINNMHQVALGYLELARDMPVGNEQAEFLDKSAEVLQRSTKLIVNVRKLQKLHDGVLQARDVDICNMLADIQSEYNAVPGKAITVNLNGQEKCFVRANELLLDVFTNLMNNAVKHTVDGNEINVSLDVVEDKGRRYCRVAVEDDGPGIPDDYKERIFNRMHKGTARGMGLGLYIVKSLVESYDGQVWSEDRVKGDHTKGARFVVMLPAAEK
jgi:PAS domain S-box-containing protein